MNIDDRIERRLGFGGDSSVVTDIDAVSPVVHPSDPTGRGPHVERLLDALDPAFAGSLPPTCYVHGPKGGGKSAVVSALFDRLAEHGGHRRQAIRTTTRAADPTLPAFIHVDARTAPTRFRLYHDALAGIREGPVPDHGVGTDELRTALTDAVRSAGDAVVAIDHVGEPSTPDAATVAEWLADASSRIVPVCLGRDPPADLDWEPERTVAFEQYRRHALVELVTARASEGLAREALTHDQVREIAEWADGDAHDALAATFGAAVCADRDGSATVRPGDLDAGIEAVPKPCVALGRVLALAESRRRLLYVLVSLSEDERASVKAATEAVAADHRVDLSASTVRRVLYELADAGLLNRVTVENTAGKGRPPSRLIPRFPTLAFRELFERDR